MEKSSASLDRKEAETEAESALIEAIAAVMDLHPVSGVPILSQASSQIASYLADLIKTDDCSAIRAVSRNNIIQLRQEVDDLVTDLAIGQEKDGSVH